MKTFFAFFKKEWIELIRTSKLLVISILFILFGIMNPALAKLTPWMMKTMSEELEESGFVINEISVDALTSWTQFYKNIPMALIAFVLLFSGILVNELQKGTLISIFAKGYARWKIITAKFAILITVWTGGYFACYAITYFYNSYFWDNAIATQHFIAALFTWCFGIMMISFIMLFSTFSQNTGTVLLGSGGCVAAMYLLSMIGKIKDYLPIKLLDGMSILTDTCEVSDYYKALIVCIIITILNSVISVLKFSK
ncbi:MAG: ABC transporter permease subunit [Lachnospiraceae bacterium]